MITSIHTLIYSDDAPATRAFLRDVLGWRYVEDAAGRGAGWLIFKTGRSELGVCTRLTPTTMAAGSGPDFIVIPACEWARLTMATLCGKRNS
jgi:catechol 2,3-dioxygenase-like lactoylglutathione lyase family enzyme